MRGKKYQTPESVIAHRLGDAMLLVNLDSSQIFELNDSGARLWLSLSEGKTVEETAAAMLEEFDISPEKLGQETEALLGQLTAEGLAAPEATDAGGGPQP